MHTYLKNMSIVCLFALCCVVLSAGIAGAKSLEAGAGYVEPKVGYYGSSNSRVNSAFTYGGEAGYFFMDNFSIGAEMLGYVISQKKDPFGVLSTQTYPGAFSPIALLRYHFLNQERFNMFGGIGLGGFFANARVPANGYTSNLTEVGELGFNAFVTEQVSLQLAGRWQHIGNYSDSTGINLWGGNFAVKYAF